MVFGFSNNPGQATHREIGAVQLAAMLRDDKAVVVDVREPDEFADGHIPGAINMPLSSFQPSRLPQSGGKQIVLTCLGGKRSAKALDQCGIANASVDTHLAGGFGAWKSAHLPIER